MTDIHSFPLAEDTWCISTDCTLDPTTLEEFTGQLDRNSLDILHDPSSIKNLIISMALYELQTDGDFTNWIQRTINFAETYYVNLENIFVLHETVEFDKTRLTTKCDLTVINIPYFLLRSALTPLNFRPWSSENNKAIFLVGDIRNRPHRFPLFYEFFTNGKLDLLEYSLIPLYSEEDHHYSWLVDWLNRKHNLSLTVSAFKELYTGFRKTLSGDEFLNTSMQGIDPSMLIYPPQWDDAALILMTESYFAVNNHGSYKVKENLYFTEKMWKPLLSRKPFVTVSNDDIIYSSLEKLGFKTFLEYINVPLSLPHNDSDDISYYANLTYRRVSAFLENKNRFADQILQDVDHNFRLWQYLSEKTWTDLLAQCPPLSKLTRKEVISAFTLCPDINLYSRKL